MASLRQQRRPRTVIIINENDSAANDIGQVGGWSNTQLGELMLGDVCYTTTKGVNASLGIISILKVSVLGFDTVRKGMELIFAKNI